MDTKGTAITDVRVRTHHQKEHAKGITSDEETSSAEKCHESETEEELSECAMSSLPSVRTRKTRECAH